jgi:hypothetical protein
MFKPKDLMAVRTGTVYLIEIIKLQTVWQHVHSKSGNASFNGGTKIAGFYSHKLAIITSSIMEK